MSRVDRFVHTFWQTQAHRHVGRWRNIQAAAASGHRSGSSRPNPAPSRYTRCTMSIAYRNGLTSVMCCKGISEIKLSQIVWYPLDNYWLEVPVWSSPIPSRHCAWKQLGLSQVAPAGSLWHAQSKNEDQADNGARNGNSAGAG